MPLRLLERAVVAALDHLEAAEEYLATCDLAVFASPVERALLQQKVETIVEEVRTMRDRVAKVMGRVEATREKPKQASADRIAVVDQQKLEQLRNGPKFRPADVAGRYPRSGATHRQ